MGSVLTVTSNPTRTSPVKRGKWILEKLLCQAPNPPPAGVEGFPLLAAGNQTKGYALVAQGFRPLEGLPEDAFRRYAHRFTALITAVLSDEERGLAESILTVHRPAHTIGALCTVAAGMRVGRGLLAGLTSVIGKSGGFATAQIGGWHLGRGAVIGRPRAASRLEASRLGWDSRVG